MQDLGSMQPSSWSSLAAALDRALRDRFIGKVTRPDPWSLGLEIERGATLGFCWHPAWAAAGLCAFPWPRGTPPDLPRFLLQGARLGSVGAVCGEPILQFSLRGSRSRMMIFESLGRSANLLLVGDDFGVLWAGRTLGGPTRTGQPGEIWNPPPPRAEPFSAPPAPPDPEGTLREGLLERGRASALKELDKRERALVRRREAVREDLRGGGDPASLSLMGQILLASGDLTRRGDALREVQDFGQDPPRSISVPLEPALSVKENARRLFKKARKAKVREVEAVRVLAGIEESILATRGDREFLASSQRMEDFFGGGTAPRTPAKQPRRDLPPDVCRVPLPDGFSGYAGKSATGNQTVSFRIGKGGDFWFHAADYPGSHVVVKNPGRLASLPGVVEMAAALYAAAHSQAPPGNRLAVTSALCKQLRPAPGHPGQVFLSGGRTLFVDLPGR